MLLVGAECSTRLLVQAGTLLPDPSLAELVEGYGKDLRERRPPIWLLGNSTLARGVIREELEDRTSQRVATLAHGSATVRASTRMLEYYLDRAARKPQRLVVLVSLDDLNPNGIRAENSRRYDDYLSWERLSPFQFLMLARARTNIKEALFEWGLRSLGGRAGGGEMSGEGTSERNNRFDEDSFRRSHAWLRLLAREYEVDRGVFVELGACAREMDIPWVRIVLLPATTDFFGFHEAISPEWPLERIRNEVEAACRENGLGFTDLSLTITERGSYADAYHLNSEGAQRLTELISELLR